MARERVDPTKSRFYLVVGSKGSGKSTSGFNIFESYPFDRIMIDNTGDVGTRDGWIDITGNVPDSWPDDDDDGPTTLYMRPDPGDPNYLDDMDRAVGLAFRHGRTAVMCDETEDAVPVNRTPPWWRRALRQGRHEDLVLIMCSIRPIGIDVLCRKQADEVIIHNLPGESDRKCIALDCGVDRDLLDNSVKALGEFEFLRLDMAEKGDDRLLWYPKLPKGLPKARAPRRT